jgi:hypothetical protein
VSYIRELSRERAQQGEVVSLRATFCNHKWLPLSLLEVHDALPRHVTLTGGVLRDDESGLPGLYIARAMPLFARITRHLEVRCVKA